MSKLRKPKGRNANALTDQWNILVERGMKPRVAEAVRVLREREHTSLTAAEFARQAIRIRLAEVLDEAA
jgi:hypothetical protein